MTIEARFRLGYPGFALEVELTLPGTGITVLFGHSGSGKTTLLRAIAGLERVPDGRLVVAGQVWQEGAVFLPTHRRPLGYVFQEASLFAHLNVRGNLLYGQRRADGADPAAFAHLVALLGLERLLDRQPAGLSGGERQRVAIARALLTRPRLLLMDEPLAALDVARRAEVMPFLEQLHAELKIPLLYVSHAPDEVARLADHLVVLEAGRVLGAGPLTETLARLDLPIQREEEAGVVLEAKVVEQDPQWHLTRIAFTGGGLWVRARGQAIGATVRVRILARDVSIALERITGTSIVNTLPATVAELGDDAHPALCLVRLDVGGSPLLARLTRRSSANLALAVGKKVWVQIKSVALIA